MWRNYTKSLKAALLASALLIPVSLSAQAQFESKSLKQTRFAVLGQPLGKAHWKLIVLEQIQTKPLCWRIRPDKLVDPTLNYFDFTGICNRYLDSNGYSLRSNGEDLGNNFRLSLFKEGNMLILKAIKLGTNAHINIGRSHITARIPNTLVLLELDPEWRLERRMFKGRNLNHLYFTNSYPINQLIVHTNPRKIKEEFDRLGAPPIPSTPFIAKPIVNISREGPVRIKVIPYSP